MKTEVGEKTKDGTGLFGARLVGLIGFALIAYIALGLVSGADWNPTVFVKFPQANPPILEYAEMRFDDIVPAGNEGHDGKYFFIQASDPFYLNPDENAYLLDRPTYRAQRMLYPAIAGGFGLFSPELIAWSLVVVNIVAVGFGTYLTSRVAGSLGLNPLFGLAFFTNPGVFVSSIIDTAEVFAMTFLMAAILMVLKRRPMAAAVFFSLSVLSRETMLLCVIGWILFEFARNHRLRWEMSLPFLAPGVWWLYLRVRIGDLAADVQDIRALGRPLEGFLSAFQGWLDHSGRVDDLLIGLALVFICLSFVYLAVTRRSLIPLMGAGFSIVALLMVEEVWTNYFDSTRALTPLITLFFLVFPFWLRRHPDQAV